jgi:transposase
MDIATYATKKEELTGLLSEAIALPQLPESDVRELKRVQRRINENEFSIVLIGEYQSGKSMTFDALCDGRELNKIGDGCKTSGCIVTTRNIADPEEPEKINVTWRTKREILAGITRLLDGEIHKRFPERFEGNKNELYDVLDLDNPADRKLITEAAPIVWNNRFKQGVDSEGVDKDILCIALLAAHFWGSPELEAYMVKTEYSLNDLKQLCHYPGNWNEWGTDIAGRESQFRIDDVLTVFIKTIDIHLHATNLKRIGCVFMDAPGLFASDWDTNIANQAMQAANAIIYIFSDRKTIKSSDCKVLDGLAPQVHGLGEKLFFAFNTQAKRGDSKRILDSSLLHLKDRQIVFTDERAAIYHAPLALRAIQTRQFIQNNLTANDMKIDGDTPPEQFLLNEMQVWHTALQGSGEKGKIDFTLEQSENLLDISGFPMLIEKVANFVLSNRWRSVLIGQGAERIVKLLERVEGNLRSRENAASIEVEQFRKEAAEKKKNFKEFSEKCKVILNPLESDSFDLKIAEKFRNYYSGAEAISCLAEKICEELKKVDSFWDILPKTRAEKTEKIFEKFVNNHLIMKSNEFLKELEDGRNEEFNKLQAAIKIASQSANALWENTIIGTDEGDLKPEWPTGDYKEDMSVFANLVEELGKGAMERVTGYFGIGASMSLAVGILMPAGIVAWWAIAPILIAGAIYLKMSDTEKAETKRYGVVCDTLRNIFFTLESNDNNGVTNKCPSKICMESIREYRGIILSYMQSQAEKPLKILVERALIAEEDFKKSHEERAKLAQEARKIRKGSFEPLRNRVEDFIARCQCL